ncbi:MAG: hypothetical protein HY048_11960 [Acidobacteria bacterium]|nr:hypothetical protein [Acidobacteriota bacterium]
MFKKLASLIFLLDSLAIGLGAFGHGLQVRHLHAAIDRFPIESDMQSMIYVVWYFVSGCMFAFGVTLLWVWRRLGAGDGRPLFVAIVIGLLYVGIGAFGLVYRAGDPFMAFFVALGGLLLLSGYAVAPRASANVSAVRL